MSDLSPRDQKYLDRNRRQRKSKAAWGWIIVLVSVGVPFVVFSRSVEKVERYFERRMHEAAAHVRAIEAVTPLEVDLQNRLVRCLQTGQWFGYQFGTLGFIAFSLYGGIGIVAGMTLILSAHKDRRYLQIVDQLRKGADS